VTRAAAAVTTVLAALGAVTASAAAAGWDATPLPLTAPSDNSPTLGPVVEATDDGATWVVWTDGQGTGPSQVLVRRISPDGVPGEERVLTANSPGYNGALALAPLPGGDVRVAYTTELGATLAVRRLTPVDTGDPVVVYDKATTVDGDGAANNGNVVGSTVKVLAAPSGASWVSFQRVNNGTSWIASARRIGGDETVSSIGAVTLAPSETDAAVDLLGRLVMVMRSGAQARTVVVRVETDGTVGSEVEIRPQDPPAPPFAAMDTPAIGIDAAGIATVGWRLDTPTARYLQARRVDTTTTPMTPQGSGPSSLNDGLPLDYVQYGPLFGVDPGGAVLMGWYETDSNQDNNDAMVRVLGAGAFADVGVVGPRLQLDGPSPEGGSVSDLVPGPAGIVTALTSTNAPLCRASRIDLATGNALSTDVLAATDCAAPVGPASGANGTLATWSQYTTHQVVLSRYVTAPPACSDGAPATVAAGESVTLSLACTGWRPVREVTGAPTKGTLGAIDQAAGTVSYTAGAETGTDQVRFRGVNAAGPSGEQSVAVTVTPAPIPDVPKPPNPPPPPDTSDHTAPALTGLSLKPHRVTLKKLRAPVLTFSLSEPATVNVAVQRLVSGRRRAGRCVTSPPPRRGARCVKAKTLKRLSAALAAGPARLRVNLLRGTRPLPAGRYRVTVSATDPAGNSSSALRASLTIARR
jgi:hypothetical protein